MRKREILLHHIGGTVYNNLITSTKNRSLPQPYRNLCAIIYSIRKKEATSFTLHHRRKTMTTTTAPALADTIKSIAAIYIASAEAAENFINTRDQEEKERHSELFRDASEKFKALIEEDSSLHDCELRELSYAITQHNFNDARARYAEIVKDNTEDTTTQENTMNTKKKYAVSNANTHNTIIRTGGFDLRTTVTGLKIIHTDLNSRLKDRVALPVLDCDSVSVKITDTGFKMMDNGQFEEFYKELKDVENTANKIQEALNQHNRQLEHHKWENEELTTGDVAELMGFSAEMIRRYCIEGKIKSRETSRGRKIKRKDAFLFMENHPKFNS